MIKLLYALRKNGKYLSSIFSPVGDGLEFEAISPRDGYRYSVKDIADDIARQKNLEVVPVYQPNAPFGDYVEFVQDDFDKKDCILFKQIKNGMALAFFASAYADLCEECGEPLRGEIMEQLPEVIDAAAFVAADKLISGMLLKNGVDDLDVFYNVLIKGCSTEGADRVLEPELFGHYCAMQAMGHGVGLESFGYEMRCIITVPNIEFGSYSLEKDYFGVQS